MSVLNIPIGISDFEKIRKNDYYFIDKSGMIAELLRNAAPEVTLITRPRRFGKTLGMSMLASFFDIRKDSRELFRGLRVSEDEALCAAWMNQYPTLFLTFKDVDGNEFVTAKDMLRDQIAGLFQEHAYLAESGKVNEYDKKRFFALSDVIDGKVSDMLLKTSIALLMRMMQAYYGKPVILLLDEYDVPLAKASTHGYYDQMLEIMRMMMSTALKDNHNLKFAIITGCLRISKESIFTGMNNLVSDSILKSRLSEYFGFTQREVDRILQDAGLQQEAERVKAWYDGYHFGKYDIYCPWDVLNYVYDLQGETGIREPVSYWKNTSDNAVIRAFIDHKEKQIKTKLEVLMNGGYIIQKIEENLTYDFDTCSDENFWSVLYLTGYLTSCNPDKLLPEDRERVKGNVMALMIPNAEIREIYQDTVLKWFEESAHVWKTQNLCEAVWQGDSETASREMTRLLQKTISYHDYHEDYYHAFLAGIFTGAGYEVKSNREHGNGRSDVVILDSDNNRLAIFEAKYTADKSMLADKCEEAIRQIEDRRYAVEFEESGSRVFCYGIGFYKKECLIRLLREADADGN